MKKLTLLCALMLSLLTLNMRAQIFSFGITPQTQCLSPNGNFIVATVNVPAPTANFYSWTVTAPSLSACAATMSATPNGTMAAILPCCGIYTITCSAWNQTVVPAVLIAQISNTAQVVCSSQLSVTSSSFGSCSSTSYTLTASGAISYTWSDGSNFPSIVVSPSVLTCYTVSGLSGGGCLMSKTICVGGAGGSVPVISTNGPNNVCSGQLITLSAVGANTYTWQPGNIAGSTINIFANSTTCYTVTGTSSVGCTGSAVKCVSVSPTPSFLVVGNQVVCPGQSTTLWLVGAQNYTWYPGGFTSDSLTLSPNSSTCYSVGASNGSCFTATSVCVFVQPLNLSVSGPTYVCAGSTATLTASGASSYTWQPGNLTGSSVVVSPSVTTCYTVTGSNGSCSGSATKCISIQQKPNITSVGGFFCYPNPVTLTASGAHTYTWLPSNMTGSTITFTTTAGSCYTVLGTAANGCSNTAISCFSVMQSPQVSVFGPNSTCPNSPVNLIAAGGSSYTWQPGNLTGPSVYVTPTTNICYTVTAYMFGCFGSAVKCLTVTPNGVNIIGPSQLCAGSSATLTATGASNYTWQPGNITGASIVVSPSVSTCYTVFTSDTTVCGSFGTKCITVVPKPNITVSGGSFCQGSNVFLQATGATTYSWLPFNLTGPSINITPSVSSCYTVIGTNSNGCTNAAANCFSLIPVSSLTVTGTNFICSGQSATLSASGSTSYTWLPGAMIGANIVVNPQSTTCYTVIGDNGLCSSSAIHCVSVQPSNLSVVDPTAVCAGSSATLSVTSPGSYTWIPGGFTGQSIVVSPSVSTCYTVIGSGTVVCGSSSGLFCLNVLSNPNIVVTTSIGCAGQTGFIGATGASTYTWYPFNSNSPNVIFTPTANGCYTVVGTGANGCINVTAGCYSVMPTPSVQIFGPNSLCAGQSATLSGGGAFSYTWLPGGFTGTNVLITPSATTCYTLLGKAFGGSCVSSAIHCVSVSPAPQLGIYGNLNVCAGSSTTLVATGANTYTWLPGNNTGVAIAVTPTANTCYTLVGTNQSGCVGVLGFCVNVNQKPNITTNNIGPLCAGSLATLTAQGGASYTWQPFNLTGQSIVVSSSVATCYTVTGADSSGCTNKAVGCFTVLPSPFVTITGNSTICAGDSVILHASGASSYTWLPGGITGPNLITLPPFGLACYTVIGSNGVCTSSAAKCVSVHPKPVITISGNNDICAGQSANLLASGAVTYTWNTGSNSALINVSPPVSTCYSVVGKSAIGCIGSAVKCLSVAPVPTITVSGNTMICQGKTTILVASGALSYQWSNGSTSASIAVNPATTTSYVVQGSNGICNSSKLVTVSVKPKPVITAVSSKTLICAGEPVMMVAFGADTYTWSTGANTPSVIVFPLVSTSYLVKGTAANGCDSSFTIHQSVHPCTGIAETSRTEGTISMYPNPANDVLTLKNSANTKANYTLYDLSGREILKGEFTEMETISINEFAKGAYIMRLDSEGRTSYEKLIIE